MLTISMKSATIPPHSSTGDNDVEDTHVIIVGCGPTGALLSALLTRFDVPHVVLEKELSIVTDPRGIALDEDGIRILQGLGLYDKIYSNIGQPVDYLLFTNGSQGLHTPPFMKIRIGTTEGGTGHVGVICHQQPVMEASIRAVAGGADGRSIRLGAVLRSISESRDAVVAEYLDANGQKCLVRGQFLVGADGKTGYTRKMYLEPRGIAMESRPGYEYKETWVAANYHITLPTPTSHPNFPLWKLNYTPEAVYEAFFPKHFRFIANPTRPAVCGTFGLREDRLWRFEFVVQGDEDGVEMATHNTATAIIFPYLTHEGNVYGLQGKIQFPPDCIEVLRCRPFTFAARSCNKWSLDRVMLCGDAAHVMPPFGGQGIASGFRDADGLAWRLAYTYRSKYPGTHADLFDGWCAERKQQLDRSIASTVRNGDLCTTRSVVKIFFRDWILWLLQRVPAWNTWLERGPRNDGMTRYRWRENMAFLPGYLAAGCLLPQVYCRSIRNIDKGNIQFSDDVIFSRGKRCLLQLIVLADDVHDADRVLEPLRQSNLHTLSNGLVSEEEATCLIHDPEARSNNAEGASTALSRSYRIATAAEFAQSELCDGRPYPLGYNMNQIRDSMKGARYVIVRPDRFVYAACKDMSELLAASRGVAGVLSSKL